MDQIKIRIAEFSFPIEDEARRQATLRMSKILHGGFYVSEMAAVASLGGKTTIMVNEEDTATAIIDFVDLASLSEVEEFRIRLLAAIDGIQQIHSFFLEK